MRIRYLILPASLALTVFFLAGCAEDKADIKGLSRYTPEILVEETLTRYKAAVKTTGAGAAEKGKGAEKSAKGKAGGADADGDKIAKAVDKYGDEAASRDSADGGRGMSTADIFESVVRKVPLIEGVSADQVYAKLDEAVDYDPELTAADKDAFKNGMAEARKKGPTTKKD